MSDDVLAERLRALAAEVSQVPQEPGCYLWKDASGTVIYVGKAKNLRARMRQYVTLSDERAKIPLMMDAVRSFDYVVVESEHEALLLERNLIAQHHPYYNVDLKDDKSYPFIAITEGDVFPCIKYTREHHRKGTRYFGPYTDARAAKETIETLRKVVPVCMGKGPGVCVGAIGTVEYARNIAQVERFLRGERAGIVAEVTDQMHEAAADLDFERAARLKARLDAIEALEDRQEVDFSSAVSLDAIGFYREETISCACVFVVREGITVRTVEFILDKGLDVGEEELVEGFVKRYYDQTEDIPAEVDLPLALSDAELIEGWLSERRCRSVRLHVPQRGTKKSLLDKAASNARHALMRYMVRTGYADDRTNQALLELESALALDAPPLRIECFDISTLHGSFTVASMVVFTDGRPDKGQYRRFKVRAELDEANDFLSMSEVLGRRYAPERMADERFGSRPDLLVVDGGKPQLTAAMNQLAELGLDIPVCGLAKSDEEVFVPWDDAPIVLPSGSASLYLIKQVRDESHRFAITFHRQLRDKAMTASILDEIEGVGPKRKKALMKVFGSMKRLRAASVEDIAAVEGIPAAVAADIFAGIHAFER